MENQLIEIYTDGSCHTQQRIGGWAALIFVNNEKLVLQGSETDTTHNRMELLAVIKSIEYTVKEFNEFEKLFIYTDSQYVERIPLRTQKFILQNFRTKSGKEIQNVDLVKRLIGLLNSTNIEFVKVKAHQKASDTPNYNREVDKLSRKIVRNKINRIHPDT
ncbi:MAG: ribonuclease HI [Bacteroidales bacterium]|nr:ribonuclease HI [Bacteroidales bacterium]